MTISNMLKRLKTMTTKALWRKLKRKYKTTITKPQWTQ
jgi:hypothetical protein